jgi:hypothetical protein
MVGMVHLLFVRIIGRQVGMKAVSVIFGKCPPVTFNDEKGSAGRALVHGRQTPFGHIGADHFTGLPTVRANVFNQQIHVLTWKPGEKTRLLFFLFFVQGFSPLASR